MSNFVKFNLDKNSFLGYTNRVNRSIMERTELYTVMEKYFALSQEEVEKLVEKKFIYPKDYDRLHCMLDVLIPACDKFVNLTDEKGKFVVDEKLKRKVGMVLLSKLNYKNFYDETIKETQERLRKLFVRTTARGVNAYKIIYNQVLTDGNTKSDYKKQTKVDAYNRYFDEIFMELRKTLNLTDKETVACFEKCSSLIAKVSSLDISKIYNTIKNFEISDGVNKYNLFKVNDSVDEVKELLLNNLSLFTSTPDKIYEALEFFRDNVKADKVESETVTDIEAKLITLRNLLKNNSSLLLINAKDMSAKNKYISTNLKSFFDHDRYYDLANELVQKPLYLDDLRQTPRDNIYENLIGNILTLETSFKDDSTKVSEYIKKNPYVLGMDQDKLKDLFEKINDHDEENQDDPYLERFFELGKSLFANSVDFDVDVILNKLENTNIVQNLKIEEINDWDLVLTFYDLFNPEDVSLNNLWGQIEDRELRISKGEKQFRKNIRRYGQKLKDLPSFLKDSQITLIQKREEIARLSQNIKNLQNKRFALARVTNLTDAKTYEIKVSKEIEKNLNGLRNTFIQKRYNIGKKYSNTDQLFEKMMKFLGKTFDDKVAISDLIVKEISEPFINSVENSFMIKNEESLFNTIKIVKVGNQKLAKSLNGLNKAINETTGAKNDVKNNDYIFEK